MNGLAGAYDGIVCMYHDQANIAPQAATYGAAG